MKKTRMIVNVGMTIVLLGLMSYSLIGETTHEILGTIMVVLFIVHHILNRKWFGALNKGRYSAFRICQTILVFLMLVSVVMSAVSGIIISKHLYVFLGFSQGMATARSIHIVCAYANFILMSLHLGLHWNSMISAMVPNDKKSSKTLWWVLRIIAFAIAGYGIYAFIKRQIGEYLFLQQQYVSFDTSEPIILFYLDYIAIMVLFVLVGHYLGKLLKKIPQGKPMTQKGKVILVIVLILIVVAVVAIILFGIPYFNRHFKTVEVNKQQVVSGQKADYQGSKPLVVYFTRVGNTDFEEDVDAVSGASLLLADGKLTGSDELLADMVSDMLDCESKAITLTGKKYPSSYGDTVSVAGDELKVQARPAIEPIDVSGYDSIILVYPLWWYSIPMPVATFLEQNNFEGKTVYLIATQGSGGYGNTVGEIEKAAKGAKVEPLTSIYCEDIPNARQTLLDIFNNIGNNAASR